MPNQRRFPPRRRPQIRRPGQPGRIHPALRRLRRAHALMQMQEYAEAGRLFEQIAKGAEQRGIPRAALLFLRAGDAQLRDGQTDKGMSLIMYALKSLERQARWRQWTALSRDSMHTLQDLGLDQEYAALAAYVQKTEIERGPLPEQPMASRPEARLPGKCPHCGGHVHPDQVEWINEIQAICDYCGSVIQGDA